MPGSTARLALPYPLSIDADNVPSDIQALATKLDTIGAVYAEGVESARPAFGTAGRFYICTDSGKLFVDNGTSWSQVNYSATQLFSTKGDLLVASAAMTGARLGAGSDGQSLVARSTATLGVDWENVLGQALNLPGATASTRFVGGTTTGPPTTGTFALGDFIVTQDATIWVCITAGSPGTWKQTSSAYGGKGAGALVIPGFATPTRAVSSIVALSYNSAGETAYPFTVASQALVKKLGVYLSGTGGAMRLGLRSSNSIGMPGALLADAGQIYTGASGTQTATIPNGGVTLFPGVIYWAICSQTGGNIYYVLNDTLSALIEVPLMSGTPTTFTTTPILGFTDAAGPVPTSPFNATFTSSPLLAYGNNSQETPPMQWLVG